MSDQSHPKPTTGDPTDTPIAERAKRWRSHRRGRPMTQISIRLPADLIDDLKDAAEWSEIGGYQALIRRYIGHGLQRDLLAMDDERQARTSE